MKHHQLDKTNPGTWLLDIIILVVLISILFGAFLGSRPLMTPDEGRYVEIPREMVESGDYVTPRLNYIKYFEKPPFFYWLESAPVKLFGINEWALRSVPAGLALLGCLLVYVASRKLFDRRTGILSALVLATSVLYFVMAHFILPDIALSVCLTGSLLAFLIAVHQPRSWQRNLWLWAMYALAAFATLTKGLVGIIFPGMIIFIWLCLVREWRQLLSFRLFSGTILFLLIAVPWHILVQQRNPEFLHFYIIEQQFLRYFTPYAGREQPLWFFPTTVLVGMFPWICFLLARLFTWKKPPTSDSFTLITQDLKTHPAPGTDIKYYLQQHKATVFLWVWVLTITLFFLCSKSLLVSYALPVMPPLAIIIGRRLSQFWDKPDSPEIRLGFALFLILTTAIAMTSLILFIPEQRTYWHLSIILLMVCGITTTLLYWYRGIKAGTLGLFIGMGIFLSTFSLTYPTIDTRSIKPLAAIMQPYLQPDTLVVSYMRYYQDLPVYLQRRVAIVNDPGELTFGLAHQNAKAWTPDKETFWHLWQQPKRMFVLMLISEYNILEWSSPYYRTLNPIALTDKTILLTNHPL